MGTQTTDKNVNVEQPQAGKLSIGKAEAVYESGGEQVRLTSDIVRNFLVRGSTYVPDEEVMLFISLCKYNKLNPFLNEAYLVKYGNSPATMVTAVSALLKRAEACPTFEGLEAGVVIERKGEIKQVVGALTLKGDTLLGGWAKVYRSDRKIPSESYVSFDDYNKKQTLWNTMPATMIRKVAIVHALREAFPNQTGALYIAEERGIVEDANYSDVKEEVRKEVAALPENQETLSITIPQQKAQPVSVPEQPAEGKPAVKQIPF
jgi:phage recombination protein Bet